MTDAVRNPSAITAGQRIGVVVPAFKVRDTILGVLAAIGPEVEAIYVVDDACPEGSGDFVRENCRDQRVRVLVRPTNGGVGAAVKTGYDAALADGIDVVVKVDGDGQMNPALIPYFIQPVVAGRADYTKGNRFFNPEDVKGMPRRRLLGNAFLSFLAKASSGYWNVFDPTNGFTAIHQSVLSRLPLAKVANGYFFESDMLFRLGVLRAVVLDIPMEAVYTSSGSSLRPFRVIPSFLIGHWRAFWKRLVYNYFLRSFSVASVELLLGIPLVIAGFVYGITTWISASNAGEAATSGQVMIAALPIIVGVQMLLSFLQFDVSSVPTTPLSTILAPETQPRDLSGTAGG